MTPNEKKFAFITCVNDEDQYKEALCFINSLVVPKGFSFECIAVRGAVSMASGYQMAMQSTDAKYKIYLHQDVFIINRGFLRDILKIFRENPAHGAIGMAGAKKMVENGIWAADRSITFGAVYQTSRGGGAEEMWLNPFNPPGPSRYAYAMMLDGLLIATQYDLDWREELFDGWHFYDLSQSAEFVRAGYRLVIPNPVFGGVLAPWCIHYGLNGGLDGGLDKAWYAMRHVFVSEYEDLLGRFAPDNE